MIKVILNIKIIHKSRKDNFNNSKIKIFIDLLSQKLEYCWSNSPVQLISAYNIFGDGHSMLLHDAFENGQFKSILNT